MAKKPKKNAGRGLKAGKPAKALKKVKPLSAELAQTMQQAVTSHQQKQFKQAEILYRKVLSARPDFPEANQFMGVLAHQLGRADLAMPYLEKAASLAPRSPEILNNFGVVLTELSRYDEAIEKLERASLLQPRYTDAHYNLGNACLQNGAYKRALRSFEAALKLDPNNSDAMTNIGNALAELYRCDEAVEYYEKAVQLNPKNYIATSNYLFHLNYDLERSPQELARLHREMGKNYPAARPVRGKQPRTPLRIGYVSNDFYKHSVAYFFEPLLKHHDRKSVAVVCYYNGKKRDEKTEALKAASDGWRDVVGMNDEALYNLIRNDQIDILVDLGGHTKGNRLKVFAMKPAPVQVSWLGYPNTTGLSQMDYRFIDDTTDPVGEADELCSETLLRLPHGFLCYGGAECDSTRYDMPCKKNGYFTFGSFNNLFKINEAVISSWSRILQQVPDSRLLLKSKQLSQDTAREKIESLFEKAGIDLGRIDLRSAIDSKTSHLELYQEIDLALDTFPYNGTTTTAEALWMGVPTVSFTGDRHAARVSASILKHADCSEFVADHLAGYEQLAIGFGNAPESLEPLRKALPDKLLRSDFCNGEQFVADMEAAFRQIWA